ncbi:MAG: leucine-rich repeat domain-containing protein [Methylococcaceae bacterium]
MFGIFGKSKKNKIQDLIEQDGLEHATQRFAEVICDMLKTKELAHQFVLEEIDAASQGDNEAMRFAFSSGIPSTEYKGAMQRSCPEIDGKDGPQQFLLNISTQLHSDTDLMVEFRTKIVDKVMKRFYLGKYASNEPAGIKKYNQLKNLMLNEEISEALILSATGINQTSILIANDVNAAVSLVNYLSTLTGISGVELINAVSEKQHDKQITSIIIDKESLEEYEAVGSDDSWMDVLVQWANENNLAELQDFDSPAYKQTGFPRKKNQLRSMEYLHLPNSNISHLPPELGNLKKLYGICLDGNSIENYPKEMCEYKNLIRLDLDDNNISNFPREIGNLTSLQILSLENNCINDFPIEMKKLVNLRELVLKGQAIHLCSKYSPLSKEGFNVYQFFTYDMDVTKEESVKSWLDKTDTSNLTITG